MSASSCAVLAVVLASQSRVLVVSWAMHRAHTDDPAQCAAAMAMLSRCGGHGVYALLALSTDLTPLQGPDLGRNMPLVPPDSVCDLAFDALRRLREGPFAPRIFEWDVRLGKFASYDEALANWRRSEFDESNKWWKAHSGEADR